MALMGAINEDGRLQDLQMVNGALKTVTETSSIAPEVIVTEQDLTASLANFGSVISMDGYKTLGLKVEGDCNSSEDVSLYMKGLYTPLDTPFAINGWTTSMILWSGTGTDFTTYYEFDTGLLPYVVLQGIATTAGNVAAYMTGGTGAQATYGTWEAITNASFQIGIDGVTYNIDGVDFTGVTDMDGVATVLETAMQTASSTLVTCVWSTDHFVITSAISTETSEISVTDTYSRTDISGVGAVTFMDSETAVGTASARVAGFLTGGSSAEDDYLVWAAISDGSCRITVDGVAYNLDALDFSGAGDMDGVAAVIQAALRTATSALETVVWSTDHFVITSVDATATSAVSVLSTSTGTVGTDISVDALSDASTNGVVTAVAPAYLTGGTAATSVVATWVAVENGAFGIDIDGTSYEIGDLDFSACTTMADVATVLETAIQTATSGTETVIWSTDHFVITSTDLTTTSEVSVTSTLTETDISGEGTAWMDSESGVGTATAVVLAGDLTITIVKG